MYSTYIFINFSPSGNEKQNGQRKQPPFTPLITLILRSLVILFICIPILSFSQTLNFTFSNDEVDVFRNITITNTSEDISSEATYSWNIQYCGFYYEDAFICNYQSTEETAGFTGKFVFPGTYVVTLYALNEGGDTMEYTPMAKEITINDIDGNIPVNDTCERGQKLEDIISEVNEYSSLQPQYLRYEKDMFYNLASDDSSLLNMGTYDDVDYEDFYDSLENSNTGIINEVYSLIEENKIDDALLKNATIINTSTIDLNRKTVNFIYLQTWAVDRFKFTQSQYSSLYSIAISSPYAAGDAVFSARVMLGIDPNDLPVPYSTPAKAKPIGSTIIPFPNPVRDNLHMDLSSIENNDITDLRIYTILGGLIKSYTIDKNKKIITIPVYDLCPGLYIFSLSNNQGKQANGKFIKQ